MRKIKNDFVLIFRMDLTTEEIQISMKQLEGWIDNLAATNKLADWGNQLSTEGRVIKPNNVITEGPYTGKRESIAGYIIIKATSFDEAVNIAKSCPILQGEGICVEVRRVEAP
jgi:hypothetical protein